MAFKRSLGFSLVLLSSLVGFVPAQAQYVDLQAPTVSAVTPVAATANAVQTYQVTYYDNVGVVNCILAVDGTDRGGMTLSASATTGTASVGVIFMSAGTHTMQARCSDAAGNVGTGMLTTMTVVAAAPDVLPPSTPAGLALTANAGGRASFSWNASSDNVSVTGYDVQIDGGAFVPVGNALSYTTDVQADGSHTFAVRARDGAGNVSGSASLAYSTSAGISSPPPSNPPMPNQPPFLIAQMSADAHLTVNGSRDALLAALGRSSCEMSQAEANARVISVFGNLTAQIHSAIENFVACGTQTTLALGAGERIGIVNSFRAAFGRVPSSEADWNDVIKIGNGRFPGQTSAAAEANARARFRVIYLRAPNLGVASDNNAVTIMAYGLRPFPRSLNSETAAIVSFRAIFHVTPTSAVQWDAVRAIAYSGATR